MTEGNLRTIHVFPSQDSYETNQGSVGADDLALIPVDILPTGAVIPFAGSTTPSGYLLCNGATVSRTTYSKLYSAIGTTYGSGDGSTTFNLPNLNNSSFLEGSNTVGTVKDAGLPNIKGGTTNGYSSLSTAGGSNGAIYMAGSDTGHYGANSATSQFRSNFAIDASLYSSIYRDDITTVQPKSVTVKFCIKY